MLMVDVEKKLGEFTVSARFEAARGVTALFGPSGSGKTSIVNMIAGLLVPDRGRVMLSGRLLYDSAGFVNQAPHHRCIGYVFQDGRLFPHMSVRGNLEYGRRMYGLKRDDAEFDRVISLLDLGHLLRRRPGTLSGGERQRVAIGRTLLMAPQLLLLDEPLASLDAPRKAEILPYLLKLRDEVGIHMVYVSHHAAEIRHIASTVVRIGGGRVVAVGSFELLDRAGGDLVE